MVKKALEQNPHDKFVKFTISDKLKKKKNKKYNSKKKTHRREKNNNSKKIVQQEKIKKYFSTQIDNDVDMFIKEDKTCIELLESPNLQLNIKEELEKLEGKNNINSIKRKLLWTDDDLIKNNPEELERLGGKNNINCIKRKLLWTDDDLIKNNPETDNNCNMSFNSNIKKKTYNTEEDNYAIKIEIDSDDTNEKGDIFKECDARYHPKASTPNFKNSHEFFDDEITNSEITTDDLTFGHRTPRFNPINKYYFRDFQIKVENIKSDSEKLEN